MKSIRKKHYLIFLSVVLLLEVFVWIAKVLTCPIFAVNYQPRMDKPDFVDKVWPPPDSEISPSCYEMRRATPFPRTKSWEDTVIEPTRGVAITINPEYLYELGVIPVYYPWQIYINDPEVGSQAFIYVDGISSPVNILRRKLNITPKDMDEAGDLSMIDATYYFGVRPILLPGKHEARLVLVEVDGTTLFEYTWEFTIVP